MQELVKCLKNFKTQNLVGIKQSFEDEGVLLEDVLIIRQLTKLNQLKLTVKIGGCEAKSDIYNCVNMDVNGIVAPMIETEFALQKFIESISDSNKCKLYINIESETGYKNIDKILKSPSAKMLSGIVIGRSDLVKSLGYDKSNVNSNFVYNMAEEIFKKAKSFGLETLMGGNISTKSIDFITKLTNLKILDYVETRNVIILLKDISDLNESIKSAIEFESIWLDYKATKYGLLYREYMDRSDLLKERL
tara:strand:- start:1283 stop:2026 length:744 start_codon:yes stop_codon:yes gene_type:complete